MVILSIFSIRQSRKVLFLAGLIIALFSGLHGKTSIQLGDSTGTAGNTIDVPLNLFTGDAVSGAQIDLYADPSIAEIATITGSLAGTGHIVDSEDFGDGRVRVVVFSQSNDFLFSEVLIDLQLVLKSTINENDRAVIVESVILADEGAGFVNSALIPHATFSGPDSSVVYKMGDQVSADSIAFDTNGSVDRVEFLVDGWPVASDTEPPYSGAFPLHYFGNVTISARAVDNDGNTFQAGEDYIINFPPTFEDWLDVFFSSEEQSDQNIGGLLADIDLDSQATLAEYAMGLHPRRRDGPRVSGFFQNSSSGTYQIGYLRPFGVSGINYTLQVSENMTDWLAPSPTATMEIIRVGTYLEEVRFSMIDLQSPRQFGRILIEQDGQ